MKRAPFSIAIVGADGRMGAAVALAAAAAGVSVVAKLTRATRPAQRERALRACACAIDFSAPAASVALAADAARLRRPAVIGTTGFTPAQDRRIRAFSRRTALLVAPNMSPGLNVLARLAALAAEALSDFDVDIVDVHHRRKRDAPSGSARLLAAAVAGVRGGRRPAISSLRAGDVVGDHSVLLAGPGERLELAHRAQSRDIFARGAIRAARWLCARRPGLYTMNDVLGL